MNIATIGALLSDSSRCRVLMALADGRTLSASVLAAEAGITRSTASEHLRKLLDADLLAVDIRGRHRYYRLSGPRVAHLLETLAQYGPQDPVRSLREGTRAHALRQARYCYDHLAGRLGVALMDVLLDRDILVPTDPGADQAARAADRLPAVVTPDAEYRLTTPGDQWMKQFGIDMRTIAAGRRPLIRHCLDWSEQRHHLAGALGQAVAQRLFALGWLTPGTQSRVVTITERGAVALRAQLGIDVT